MKEKTLILIVLIVLTIAACIIDDEIVGLITLSAWLLAFYVKIAVDHKEYRSYWAKTRKEITWTRKLHLSIPANWLAAWQEQT